MPIWDERMILIMQHAIDTKICETQKEFFDTIGFRATSLAQVRAGDHSFRHTHILAVAKKFGVNINWIYGLEANMIRELKRKHNPVARIRESLIEIEAAMKR